MTHDRRYTLLSFLYTASASDDGEQQQSKNYVHSRCMRHSLYDGAGAVVMSAVLETSDHTRHKHTDTVMTPLLRLLDTTVMTTMPCHYHILDCHKLLVYCLYVSHAKN